VRARACASYLNLWLYAKNVLGVFPMTAKLWSSDILQFRYCFFSCHKTNASNI